MGSGDAPGSNDADIAQREEWMTHLFMSQTDGKFMHCGPHITKRNDIKRVVGDSHGVFAMVRCQTTRSLG